MHVRAAGRAGTHACLAPGCPRSEAPLIPSSLWAPTASTQPLPCGARQKCCWLFFFFNSLLHQMTVTGTVLSLKAIPMHLAQEHEQWWEGEVCARLCCLCGAQKDPGRNAPPDPQVPHNMMDRVTFLRRERSLRSCSLGQCAGDLQTPGP